MPERREVNERSDKQQKCRDDKLGAPCFDVDLEVSRATSHVTY